MKDPNDKSNYEEAFGRECDEDDEERDSSGVYEGQGQSAEYD